MAIKFESVFAIPKRQLLLAVKAAVFGVSLWLLASGGFGFFELVAFWLIAGVLYFKPMFNSAVLLRSFLILIIIAPIAISTLEASERYPFFFAALFGVLFFVMLIIKQNLIVDRTSWHYFLFLALLYTLFMLFFSGSSVFILRALLTIAAALFLFKEFWLFRSLSLTGDIRLINITINFLIFEVFWAVSLLPLGFLNAAAITLISSFAVLECSHLYVTKTLTQRLVSIRLGLSAGLILLVFLNTNWNIP